MKMFFCWNDISYPKLTKSLFNKKDNMKLTLNNLSIILEALYRIIFRYLLSKIIYKQRFSLTNDVK